ncbi:MAG: 30S ribosomal protein S16 [Porphyromonas sp.]|nr:30S ribosomal protein S16 [Porphyromonas sp.]
MATKIRLQRHGHKDYPFYKIVIADSRAPRDGKFIERIGSYNPNTNPATIDLNFERALYWLGVGAQPTDTTRNILSREGVLLKKHLLGGVKKGAFDEATAESRFEAWRQKKQDALNAVAAKRDEAKAKANAERLSAEQEINKVKAQALADKRAAEAKAKAEEEAAKEAAEAEAISAEAPATEEEAPATEA